MIARGPFKECLAISLGLALALGVACSSGNSDSKGTSPAPSTGGASGAGGAKSGTSGSGSVKGKGGTAGTSGTSSGALGSGATPTSTPSTLTGVSGESGTSSGATSQVPSSSGEVGAPITDGVAQLVTQDGGVYTSSCDTQKCTGSEVCGTGPYGSRCVHSCPGQPCASGVPYCDRQGGVICRDK